MRFIYHYITPYVLQDCTCKSNQIIQTHILCAYIVHKCLPILYEVYQQEIGNYCCFKFSFEKYGTLFNGIANTVILKIF